MLCPTIKSVFRSVLCYFINPNYVYLWLEFCVLFSFSVLIPETKDEYNYSVFLFLNIEVLFF